eukprot:TRINITY_DN34573_c0_g1_i1.p1 TRINITY_DN34573_c0_g1~~TRINITY_DN34573_c0_g1_i1.p1  ORF type:complete len:240 (+),score=71.27 TRINITY_DN34573_c0_g1_i1:72-722(+)
MGGATSREPTAEELARAREVQEQVVQKAEGTEAVGVLEELWSAMQDVDGVGGEFEAVGDVWKRWGFQGRDPLTDIRGGGMGTLKWLVYLAKEEKDTLREVCTSQRALRASSSATQGFPVFVAAISVYRAALTSLNILTPGGSPQPLPTPTPTWHLPPYQVAATLLLLTSDITVQRKARYMEFNLTLKTAQEQLDSVLRAGVGSVAELNSKLGVARG